jgi:hypothetical protein
MPTPDASAFTRQNKLRAMASQARDGNQKVYTHLYGYVPTTSGLTDFLPSFSNKFVSPRTFLPINRNTGQNSKIFSYQRVPYIR